MMVIDNHGFSMFQWITIGNGSNNHPTNSGNTTYAWNRLGELYEHFYTTWQDVAPQQMIDTFHEQVNHISRIR